MLLEELTLPRIKFCALLEENNFTKQLRKSITQESLNVINCKYYDADEFNTCVGSSNTSISLVHVNLQSSFKNYGLLKAHLDLLSTNFDIIAISEAGKDNHDRCAYVFGDHYNYFYKAHASHKGGVACFIHKRLNPVIRDDLLLENDTNLENMWIDVSEKTQKYVIGVLYRHPGYSTNSICKGLETNLTSIAKENKIGLVCGDINIDLAKPDHPQTKLYIDTCLALDSIPLITLPTRITSQSATIIDHINISGIDKVRNCDIFTGNLFFEIADHLPNFVVLKDKKPIGELRYKTRIFSERNTASFKSILSQISWDDVLDCADPNEGYSLFMDKYCVAFEEAFPETRISRKRAKDKIWLTAGLKISIKHKNRLHRRFIKKPTQSNKAIYSKYKNKLTSLIRKCEKDYYSKLLTDNKNNIKNIWKIYSQFMNTSRSNSNHRGIDSLKVENKVLTEDKKMADAFNNYFSTIGENMARKYEKGDDYKDYLTESISSNLFLSPITEQELFREICKLPAKKSSGLDNISSKVLKATSNSIITPLAHIYNCSFLSAAVPDSLKVAKVIPIHKKGNKSQPNNYRPISLLSTFNKLLEKIVYKRLYGFLNNNNILNDYQFGFRKGHSTILAITEIVDNIRNEVDNGNSVIGIYVDLSKAFDCVNHDILLNKLKYYGVRGHALDWFSSYLSSRSQVTYVNGTPSYSAKVRMGVPQGSVLGPLLFLIYINDINRVSENALIRLFADDTNIFVCHKYVETAKVIAEDTLVKLVKWFSANHLTINMEKTSFNVYSNKKHNVEELIFSGNKVCRSVVSRYLGILLDEGLTWSNHIEDVCNKLMKLTYVFRSLARFIDKSMACQLYYAYVYPYITYGIEMYGTACKKYISKLQIMQNRLLKILTCKPYRYNSLQLHNELKILTVNSVYSLYVNVFVFKQYNHMLPNIFNQYYQTNECLRGCSTRQSSDFYVPKYKTTFGSKSTKIIGSKLWNSTPKIFKCALSVKTFKCTKDI